MAAGNDLRNLDEWIRAHLKVPKEPLANLVGAGRWFMQLRLSAAVLHEALSVLSEMDQQGHLAALEKEMSPKGLQALAVLRRIVDGTDKDVKRLLERVRHKGTFHYDNGQFRKSLRLLLAKADGTEESHIVWESPGFLGGDTYYQVAEPLRTEATLGIGNDAQTGTNKMMQITTVIATFRGFLQEAFIAYVKLKGLQSEFKRDGG